MGMPRNGKSKKRIVTSSNELTACDRRSLWQPPKVAATLATKAPVSSELNSHSVAPTEPFPNVSAASLDREK